MKKFASIGFFLLLALLPGLSRSAEYAFQTIDFPGAYQTTVEAINDLGEVTGTYQLPVVVPKTGGGTEIVGGHTQGFRWKDGFFSAFSFPDATNTFPSAITNKGDSVGIFDPPTGPIRSFLYTTKRPKDNWQILEIGAPGEALAVSLNEQRQIVGQLPGQGKGFLWEDGEVSDLEPAVNCPVINGLGIGPTGINKHGDIVGWYACNGSYGGFFSDDLGDNFTLFDLPGTLGVTIPLAINRKGVIAGIYFDTLLGWRPWILKNGTFTKPEILNARDYADIKGISDTGEIAGTYVSVIDGRNHGFIAVPVSIGKKK